MSFIFEAGVFKDRYISGGKLRGEITEIEWNKFISFYLKPGKAPGPSKVPNELTWCHILTPQGGRNDNTPK
jgi:hypothetical protein